MDETFFTKSKKGCKTLQRPPHPRGTEIDNINCSQDQICIFTARDRSNHSVESITGSEPTTEGWLTKNIAPLIASDAVIVSRNQAQILQMVHRQKLEHIAAKTQLDRCPTGAFHTQHVNAYHSQLKEWINGHFHGVATKYLNHYLNWKHEIENKHIQSSHDLFLAASCQIPQLNTT